MTRKLLMALALLAAPAAFAQPSAAVPGPIATVEKAPASKAHVLSRVEFDELLKHPEKVLLIDVRRPDEITAKGGFPVYLSIQIGALESSLAWIPKDRRIVTVSNHAARAGKAADLLSAKGYKVVGAIGVEGYEKEGGTLTRIVPPAADGAAGAAAPATTGALLQTQH
jgi:rhodanese-related sulfurtransferase